jgi:hypothetical protein
MRDGDTAYCRQLLLFLYYYYHYYYYFIIKLGGNFIFVSTVHL